MSSNIRITKICQFCNNEFTAKTIKTKFCSLSCNSKNYKKCSREKKKVSSQLTECADSAEMERLKKLEFLSIDQASTVMGISQRTLYRVLSSNELRTSKIGTKTFIGRSDIDKFIEGLNISKKTEEVVQNFPGIENCYTISEAHKKFKVSPSALYNMLRRKEIVKFNIGKFVYVSKSDLDVLFNIQSHE